MVSQPCSSALLYFAYHKQGISDNALLTRHTHKASILCAFAIDAIVCPFTRLTKIHGVAFGAIAQLLAVTYHDPHLVV